MANLHVVDFREVVPLGPDVDMATCCTPVPSSEMEANSGFDLPGYACERPMRSGVR